MNDIMIAAPYARLAQMAKEMANEFS
jgi:hypothetical protein